MHVTIVVGEQERKVLPAETPWWARPRADELTPATKEEQDLLDEITRLCQDILLIEESEGKAAN